MTLSGKRNTNLSNLHFWHPYFRCVKRILRTQHSFESRGRWRNSLKKKVVFWQKNRSTTNLEKKHMSELRDLLSWWNRSASVLLSHVRNLSTCDTEWGSPIFIRSFSLELRPSNSYFVPSRFRKAWPASTKAGVAPVSKSREKMPRNQMCCGKCLDDIKDLSWVTERHVSWRNAKELGRWVRWIFAQKPSFHWRFLFFWLIIPQPGFYITYLIDLTDWTKSSSGPTKKHKVNRYHRYPFLVACAFPAIFRGGCNPFIQQLVQNMDDFLSKFRFQKKTAAIEMTTEYDVSLSTSAPLDVELKVGPRIRWKMEL